MNQNRCRYDDNVKRQVHPTGNFKWCDATGRRSSNWPVPLLRCPVINEPVKLTHRRPALSGKGIEYDCEAAPTAATRGLAGGAAEYVQTSPIATTPRCPLSRPALMEELTSPVAPPPKCKLIRNAYQMPYQFRRGIARIVDQSGGLLASRVCLAQSLTLSAPQQQRGVVIALFV